MSILLIATIIGTPAALVWLIASIVCGFSPSSAATTRMTMSVTLAPRARISVNASWPGVSRKVTFDLSGSGYLIGTDMLGDAAGLAGDDVGAPDRVEQAGLAVIDMAHDRDHGRARLQRFIGVDIGFRLDVDVAFADALDVVAEFGDEQLGRVLIDHLVDGDRHAHLEQRFDQIGGALGHAVGELADGDRLGNDHVADLLGRGSGLHVGALFLLARALQRGEAAGAGVAVLAERPADRELAALAAMLLAAPAGARRLGAPGGRMTVAVAGGLARTGTVVAIVGWRGRLGRRLGGLLRRFLGGEAGGFGRFFLGLAILLGAALLVLGRGLGLLVVAAARFLGRGQAGLLGLAQQFLLQFLAGLRAIDLRRGGLRRGLGGARDGRRRGLDGLRLRRLGLARAAENAALLHLDDHGVRAAVAEALLHLARLDRAPDAQRRPRSQCRLVRRLAHAISFKSNLQPKRPASPPSRRLAHSRIR